MLLIASVLASGCVQQPGGTTGGPPEQNNTPPQNPPPSAPAGLQPGDWSQVALTTTSAAAIEFTYKSVEATIKGTAFSGIETETSSGSSLILWEKGKERSAAGIRMYSLSRFGQIVLCNAITAAPQNLPGESDPYAKGGEGVTYLGTGTYTTPTSKTVSVSKYLVATGNITGEYWYSSKVPFSIVRSETNTTVVGKLITAKTELQDFGKGAASAFKQQDFDKCN